MFDNRDLNIAKSKRMEQYIREICEIFTHFVDEHFVPHFQSNWRETWRRYEDWVTDFLGDTSSLQDTSLLCFVIEIVLEKETLA